jgi:membrane protease YdiL (CAAX protease family)
MLSEKPWRVEAVMLFCAAQFLCLAAGLTVIGLLQKAGLAAFQSPNGLGTVLLLTLSFQGATWPLIGIFLWWHQTDWRDAFGLRNKNLPLALLAGLVVAILLLFVVLPLQAGSVALLEKLGWPQEEEAAVRLLAGAQSPALRVYLGFFAVVLAPVAEEFIFRGMLYPFVKQLGWPRLALFGVSLLFAAIHCDPAAFVSLFVLALVLTWLYEFTDNLLAPIAAHAFFNGINLAVLYFQPQINEFLEKILRVQLLK